MIRAEAIDLVSQSLSVDSIGDSIAQETSRTVFAEVKSIGLKRKLEAEQRGLKLEYKFILSNVSEYNDERIAVYSGKRYNIVNVFVADDDKIELTVSRF